MCTTCGCSTGSKLTLTRLDDGGHKLHYHHDHDHDHDHDQGHGHGHTHSHSHTHTHHHSHEHGHGPHTHFERDAETVRLEANILSRNDRFAAANRERLLERNILALNLVSSPGSGKTTLLERTLHDLKGRMKFSVIEGDQQTLLDAERIRAAGCPVVQLNTGAGCHLEAEMLAQALDELQPPSESVVLIENVGNLVCPALFDLGEHAKVAILSVTEGQDKPLKYPHMFRASALMIINKIDLLPHVEFDVEQCIAYARQVNPDIDVLQVSATKGTGMQAWYDWLFAVAGIAADATEPAVGGLRSGSEN